jgi:hypothetical protein
MFKYKFQKIEQTQLDRMQSIIENECSLLNIEPQYIAKGCDFASYEYQQHFDFVKSVDSGIAVAKKCQHNATYLIPTKLENTSLAAKTETKFKPA